MSLCLLLFHLVFPAAIGSLTSLSYWNRVLPNTPVPDALKVFLPSESNRQHELQKVKIPVVATVTPILTGRPILSYHGGSISGDPPKGLFFLETDVMAPGSKIDLTFLKALKMTKDIPTFLPRQEAETIPFSTSSFAAILEKFSLRPDSREASVMKNTLEECETPSVKGETSYCATSLESMIDFAISQLETNRLRILTSSLVHLVADEKHALEQPFRVSLSGVAKINSGVAVACHVRQYAYAVFYCHKSMNTRSYLVPLVASDGSRVDATAICHTNTSAWNPKHPAFKVLGVKPGGLPICHFLPLNHIAWIPK